MTRVALIDPRDPGQWLPHVADALAPLPLDVWPDLPQPEAVEVAVVVGGPGVGAALAGLPRLGLVCSLWAGVERLLEDPAWPRGAPLVRLIDPWMTASMAEAALTHVLAAHRRLHDYAAQQRAGVWRPLAQKHAFERRVGVLGFGALGQAAAAALADRGLVVSAWSRAPRAADGVVCRHGADGLAAVLADAEILVNLLPLTAETRGLLNAAAFARMPMGACLVNLGRGPHVVDADLIAALDAGRLAHAALDVFAEEPLPAGHPFWTHPKISVLPHVAAITDPRSAAHTVAATIARWRAGQDLGPGLVDPARGY